MMKTAAAATAAVLLATEAAAATADVRLISFDQFSLRTADPGQTVVSEVKFTWGNFGPSSIGSFGPFGVPHFSTLMGDFYLSRNTAFGDGDDVLLLARSFPAFAPPGQVVQTSFTVEAPLPVSAPGAYNLFLRLRHASSTGLTDPDPSDNHALASTLLDVTGPPVPCSISPIADQSLASDESLVGLPFVVAETAGTVTAVSADESLVRNLSLVIAGSGTNRTLSLTPVPGQSGTVRITVTAACPSGPASAAFNLTVQPPPEPRQPAGNVLFAPKANSYAAGPMITGLARTDDFTIEGWVYIPGLAATTGIPGYVFFQNDLATVEIDRSLFGNHIEIFFGVATGEPKEFDGPVFSRPWLDYDNEWHHIACVHDAGTGERRIYFDGVITAPGIRQTLTLGSRPAILDQVLIGGAYEPRDLDWGFQYDDIRISKGERYTANFTPPAALLEPDADTMALWNFDEPDGAASFADSSGLGRTLLATNGARALGTGAVETVLSIRLLPGGELELTLEGPADSRHRIDSSTDLAGWNLYQELTLTSPRGILVIPKREAALYFRTQQLP